MQAIKEKLNDLSAMRKAKAEAREEERAERELAKARVEVAHEVRMAKEAEAAMDLHVHKAVEKAKEHERKHRHLSGGSPPDDLYDGGDSDNFGSGGSSIASVAGTGYSGSPPPTNNKLL